MPPASMLNVLVVDDDKEDLALLMTLLETGSPDTFAISGANTYAEGVQQLSSDNEIDVAVIDHRLGPQSAFDLITEARSGGFAGAFVLITGAGSEMIDERALDAGAAGYITKQELEPAAFSRIVRYAGRSAPVSTAFPADVPRTPRKGDLALQMALAKGRTIREAAAAAGISERTAHRRIEDAQFLEEVEKLKLDLRQRAIDLMAQDLSDGAR